MVSNPARTSVEAPGKTSRRRWRWFLPVLLVIAWLALGGIGGPFTGKLAEVATNDSSTFLPASAEATQVNELQQQFTDGRAIPAFIVAERDGGITGADRQYLDEAAQRIRGVGGVDQVSPAIPSGDGKAAQVVVAIDANSDPSESVMGVRDVLNQSPAGLNALVSGPAAQVADLREAFSGVDGLLLLVTGGVVFLILVVVYRSPVLPIVVLLSASFALSAAAVAVYFLADAGSLVLNGQSQGIDRKSVV